MSSGLTQARLKEVVKYDPETGIFTALPGRQGVKAGSALGHVKDGYRRLIIDGKLYYAHRLAHLYMTGEWPPLGIDHANRDRSDNRWSNLRPADQSENLVNRPMSRKNTTGYRGVFPHKDRFRARIQWRGKATDLGIHPTAEQAAEAYRRAAHEMFGKFAPKELA